MRDMQRTSLVLTTILVLAQPAFATGMEHGDMVAVIRSADYPCQQVLDLQDTGDNAWREVTPKATPWPRLTCRSRSAP